MLWLCSWTFSVTRNSSAQNKECATWYKKQASGRFKRIHESTTCPFSIFFSTNERLANKQRVYIVASCNNEDLIQPWTQPSPTKNLVYFRPSRIALITSTAALGTRVPGPKMAYNLHCVCSTCELCILSNREETKTNLCSMVPQELIVWRRNDTSLPPVTRCKAQSVFSPNSISRLK